MIPVSGLTSGALSSPSTVSGVQAPPKVQCPEAEEHGRPAKSARDEYVPEEDREPTGRYWLDRDEEGRPKVCFDDPERKNGKKVEQCKGSTDQVDREIQKLKQRRDDLARQLDLEPDEAKRRQLEKELAQVESELRQKDNDAYRRQHSVFS